MRPQKRGPTQLVCARFVRGAGCSCNACYRYDDLLKGILDNLLHLAIPDDTPENVGQPNITAMRNELQRKRDRLEQLADEMIESDDPTLRRAYERFKGRVVEDENALKKLGQLVEEKAATLPPGEIASRVAALRSQMDDSADARLKVQSYLDQLIDAIFLNPEDRSAIVVLVGGKRALKLSKHGELMKSASVPDSMMDEAAIRAMTGDDTTKEIALRRLMDRAPT